MLPGKNERISKGMKLHWQKMKASGSLNPGAVETQKRRDQLCKELAPIFEENATATLQSLSYLLASKGYLTRNKTPFSTSTVAAYKKRIAELTRRGKLPTLD